MSNLKEKIVQKLKDTDGIISSFNHFQSEFKTKTQTITDIYYAQKAVRKNASIILLYLSSANVVNFTN